MGYNEVKALGDVEALGEKMAQCLKDGDKDGVEGCLDACDEHQLGDYGYMDLTSIFWARAIKKAHDLGVVRELAPLWIDRLGAIGFEDYWGEEPVKVVERGDLSRADEHSFKEGVSAACRKIGALEGLFAFRAY
jgi:hypothetical protein